MFHIIFRRVFAYVLTVAVLLSMVTFSSASAPVSRGIPPEVIGAILDVDFVSWAIDQVGDIISPFAALLEDDICPFCPTIDKRHSFVKKHTMVGDKTGLFYVCEYCGKSAGEVFEPAYDNYVAELPATAIGSDGGYWVPFTFDLTNVDTSYSVLGDSFILRFQFVFM